MDTSLHTRSNYDKFPATETEGRIWRGWEEIGAEISRRTDIERPLVVFDTYHGVHDAELTGALARMWPDAELIRTEELFRDERQIRSMTQPYVTDDELFGYLSPLGLATSSTPNVSKRPARGSSAANAARSSTAAAPATSHRMPT